MEGDGERKQVAAVEEKEKAATGSHGRAATSGCELRPEIHASLEEVAIHFQENLSHWLDGRE